MSSEEVCEERRDRAKDVIIADANSDKNSDLVGIMRGVQAMVAIVIALVAASVASFRSDSAALGDDALGVYFSATAVFAGLFLGWIWWRSMTALVHVTSARIEAEFAVIDAEYDDCMKRTDQP